MIDFTGIFRTKFRQTASISRTHLITISDGTTLTELGTAGCSTFRKGSPLLAHFFPPRRGLPQQAWDDDGQNSSTASYEITHKNPPLFARSRGHTLSSPLFLPWPPELPFGYFKKIFIAREETTRHLLRKCTTKQAFTHSEDTNRASVASSRASYPLPSVLRFPFCDRRSY